jgi:biotin carboxylase
VIRIVAPGGNYDYQNKYFSDDTGYHCPSGLPADEEAEIQRLTLAAYRVLGCRGWGRADLMLRASDRKPFLLEMNTSPGMTGHSLVPMSARAAGIDYPQLCVRLLQAATLDRDADCPNTMAFRHGRRNPARSQQAAAAWPAAGRAPDERRRRPRSSRSRRWCCWRRRCCG